MARLNGPPRRGILAAIVGGGEIVGGFLIGHPTWVERYRAMDEDTLVVDVTAGGSGTWTWMRAVDETDETVTIAVRTVNLPVPMASIGYPRELAIDLQQPLGERVVLDAHSGEPVPRSP